jgi:hypothetical protein
VKRLLAALACALVLTACSDDSSSTADPPTPTTSAPSDPTSSPTEEAESPEDFVRRWVDVDREMQNSGDTEEYRKLAPNCRPCNEVADQVEGYYAAGGYVKTDGWTINSASTQSTNEQSAAVTIDVDSAPTEVVEAKGRPVQHLEGGKGKYLITLKADGSSWLVTDLEAVAQ